jgi:hypothetical protein
MSTLTKSVTAQKIWFDEDYLWLILSDGRQLATPLSYFPRLLRASKEQREKFEVTGGGRGIHWDELDEDISVDGIVLGIGDQTNHHLC